MAEKIVTVTIKIPSLEWNEKYAVDDVAERRRGGPACMCKNIHIPQTQTWMHNMEIPVIYIYIYIYI